MRILPKCVGKWPALLAMTLAGVLMMTGCGSSTATSSNVTATPSFSPAGGTYSATQSVAISDATTGAVLYCTTDGTTPTTSSPQCAQPTKVYKTEFLQAIAVAPGKTASSIMSAGYVIDLNAVATPSFSPAGGTYTSAQTVTIDDTTTGANIYYTTDGTTPTTSSKLYTGAVTVSATETITAIAVASGYDNSGTASATYSIAAAPPTFSPAGGTYTSIQTVTLSDTTSGASIYYTTDGTTPTTASTKYSSPITVSTTEIVQAIAVASGYDNSTVAATGYAINLTPAATPTFSESTGTYTTTQSIAISDATPGAVIYYTIDGSTPTTSSAKYSAAISVSSTETISAIAVATGYANSQVATDTITINTAGIAAPTFSVAAGTYSSAQSITLSDTSPSTTIYYTVDGSTPTTTSAQYAGTAIQVAQNETINAIAVGLGGAESTVASAAYVISAATPTFSPSTSSTYIYNPVQPVSVTISDTSAGATIYYCVSTTSCTPTTASTQYTGAISVSQSETISAIAVAPNYGTSASGSAAYTITASTPVIVSNDATPSSGTYSAAQTISITDTTPSAAIYYTTDGSKPTTASTAYTGPFTLSSSKTVKAIAAAANYGASQTAVAAFSINATQTATPTFALASGALTIGGTFNAAQSVTINDATSGATIYYTTDGSTPTTSSSTYSAAISLPSSASVTTIKAYATSTSLTDSQQSAATFDFVAAAPVFTLASGSTTTGGTFSAAQQVTISDTTPGVTIRYIGGANPTTPISSWLVYTSGASITINESETLNAVATLTNFDNSTVSSAAFTLSIPAPSPTISPDGAYFDPSVTETVTLALNASGDPHAEIYYTTDGTTPSGLNQEGTLYTGPFSVSSTSPTVVNAVEYSSAYTDDSPVVSATFTPLTGQILSGKVVSGGTAIAGATVELYAAGTTGYNSAPTLLTTTPSTVTTASDGSFLFSYGSACPAAPGDLLYLVASGGAYGSNTSANSNIKLMTALGSCNSTSFPGTATVNEVTTIASAYALSGFAKVDANGGIDIGAPATYDATKAPSCQASSSWKSTGPETCNYNGLVNAFKAVNNLANVTGAAQSFTNSCAYASSTYTCTSGSYSDAAGAARSITPAYANGNTPTYGTDGTLCAGSTSTTNGCNTTYPAAPFLNASTVPTDRINALADMLATCVESDGSGCASGLFTAAATGAITTTSTLNIPNVTPIDTLQAALNIAQNPGNNVSTLLGLIPTSNPPYTTAISTTETTPPADLLLALSFTGAGLGINPNTIVSSKGTLTTTINSTAYTTIAPPYNTALTVDASGNVWVAAYVFSKPNSFSTKTISPYLAVFDNQGTPLTTPTTVSGTAAAFGGFSPAAGDGNSINEFVFDQAGNLWVLESAYTGPLDEVTGFPSSLTSAKVTFSSSLISPTTLAVDGNIASGQTAGNVWVGDASSLWEISPGSQPQQYLLNYGYGGLSKSFAAMVFDSQENMWGLGIQYGSMTLKDFTEMAAAPSSPSSPYSITGTAVTDGYPSGETSTSPAPPIAGSGGNLYLCGDTGGTVVDTFIAGNGKVNSFTPASGRGCGKQMVLDGQGHIFAVMDDNYLTYFTTLLGPHIDEFSTTGTQILPLVDAVPGFSSAEPPTLAYGGVSSTFNSAMDASGNLWIVNRTTNNYEYVSGTKTATNANVLVEFVGIGAPVSTPASVALSTGTLGARP